MKASVKLLKLFTDPPRLRTEGGEKSMPAKRKKAAKKKSAKKKKH
jgi:hypothetical protein